MNAIVATCHEVYQDAWVRALLHNKVPYKCLTEAAKIAQVITTCYQHDKTCALFIHDERLDDHLLQTIAPLTHQGLELIVVMYTTLSIESAKNWLGLPMAGYLSADMTASDLNIAFKWLIEGQVLYPKQLLADTDVFNERHRRRSWFIQLTKREMEIAEEVLKGFSNKHIASHFGIAERTVKAHLSSIFEKTGASDRYALFQLK